MIEQQEKASPLLTVETPLLSVENLRIDVPAGAGTWLTAVDDVTFSIGRGETVSLVGESGSGKTLVATSIMGLSQSTGARIVGGSIHFDGRDLTTLPADDWRKLRGREMGMIFQQPIRSLNPAFTIGDQIAESARMHLGLNKKQAKQRAVEMLDLVKIPRAAERANDYPFSFSGGMCQRAMIAMAMVANPRLLIADEPTTALDVTVQAQILELITELQAETGVSMLLVSHDLGVVAENCDRVVVMYAGQVAEEGSVADIFEAPRHPYTSALLGSVAGTIETDRGLRLRTIPGSVPQVGQAPAGCRFQPRCEFAKSGACDGWQPLLVTAGADRSVRCARADELILEGVAS